MPIAKANRWTNPPSGVKYAVTSVSVASAVVVSWVLLDLWHSEAFASVFFCAVIFSAWVGGFTQAFLGVAISGLAFDYFFLSPTHSLYLDSSQLPRLIIFVVSALLVGFLTASQRSTTESLRSARDDLWINIREIERTNEELRTENSERKLAQIALRRSRAYLAEAQSLSHTGSFGWSVASGEIIWSEETFRIFQYDRTMQPTLELILQRVHPEDASLVKETIERASLDLEDFDRECRLVMPDRSVKYIRVVAHILTDESKTIEFVGAVMDITPAKESEEQTRLIIDTVPAQLWTETPEGVVDFVNRRWIDYTGMTLEQAVGSGWNRMVHPDDLERVLSKWRKLISEGKPREIESRLRRSDGEYRWFLSRICPLVDRAGHILGWYGIDTDIHDRKVAEETLRRSESYLAEAQRLSHTGSWAWLPATGEIKYMSEECCRVLGFNPHSGQPRDEMFFQSMHPDDQARVREAVKKAARERSDFELDHRIVHPGGEIRDIQVVGHPVLSPTGDLIEFVGTVIDITDRKRAEGSLRRSEGYLAEAERLSHTGSWASKPASGENTYWSEECYRLMGFDPHGGQPGFETVLQRYHPDDQAKVREAVETAQREKAGFELDYRIIHPGGEVRDIHVVGHPVLSPSGDFVEFVGTVVDITERKRAEGALRRSEAYLAEAQRLTHTGSWAYDIDTKELIHSSEEHRRLFGFDPERGVPPFEELIQRIHPEDRDPAMREFQSPSPAGTDFDAHFRIVHPDGTTKYVYGTGHRIFGASGNLVEFFGTVVDITERKRAEEERERLRQAHADLAHINRVTTMGELTASLAHEVNQPIAAAITNANTCLRWLTRDQPDVEEARQAAMRIVKDGTRAAEIISRIRLVFKKGAPEPELVDVNEVIREMIVLLGGEATQHYISFRTELATGLPNVTGDRVQLQQVVMNLIVNSIDAMKDVDEKREILLKSERAENNHIMVSVSDTGVGLPPQRADLIFNAFFTTKPHGTGMGLRICRSIVESHGGRLWAADNYPRGASFSFTLPSKAEAHE